MFVPSNNDNGATDELKKNKKQLPKFKNQKQCQKQN